MLSASFTFVASVARRRETEFKSFIGQLSQQSAELKDLSWTSVNRCCNLDLDLHHRLTDPQLIFTARNLNHTSPEHWHPWAQKVPQVAPLASLSIGWSARVHLLTSQRLLSTPTLFPCSI